VNIVPFKPHSRQHGPAQSNGITGAFFAMARIQQERRIRELGRSLSVDYVAALTHSGITRVRGLLEGQT
jgi:hypothetical protein